MKSRKHTMFLMISLAVFVASVIAVILYFCEAIAELNRILSEVTDTQERVGLEEGVFGVSSLQSPFWEQSFLLSEVFIRC